MFRATAQRWFVTLAIAGLGGWACKGEAERRPKGNLLAEAVYTAKTAIAASERIARWQLSSCSEMGQVFTALDTGPWNARELQGLVEELVARGRGLCSGKANHWPPGIASSVAQSLLAPSAQEALAALVQAPQSAAILRLRASLFFNSGDDVRGRDALIESLGLEDDAEVRARAIRLLRLSGGLSQALSLSRGRQETVVARERIAVLSALGRNAEVLEELAGSAVHVRQEWAQRAVAASPNVEALAGALGARPSLLLEASHSPRVSDTARSSMLARASALAPERAEIWMALAEAEEARGEHRDAIVAWDRAAGLATGAERPVLAPIRILHLLGDGNAVVRASRLAAQGRLANTSESLHLASQAHRYAGRANAAVALAKEALALDPGQGRLQSELAHRLIGAGRNGEAAEVLAALLVCGSRSRPWHRHEVAARLVGAAGKDAASAAMDNVSCATVAPEDLALHVREAESSQ